MRPSHSSPASAAVSAALCQFIVCQLALADYHKSVPALLLARLLLLACATRQSLSFAAQRCDNAPSDETVRKALLDNLPGQDLLLARLVDALHELLPGRSLRRSRLPAAIDYHGRPYYGAADTPGVRGGKRQAGTNFFWTFATLTLLAPDRRYTLALVPVPTGQTPSETVALLLGQAERSGVRLRYLLLDKGFYDAEVINLLQRQGLRFVVPVVHRGDAEEGTGTTRFFQAGCGTGWYAHGWTAQPRRPDETGQVRRLEQVPVTVAVCVVRRPGRGNWVFAASGINWPPGLVARRYRARFGIETSYRQLGCVLATTTSKDGRVRLLLIGLALLLRQWACRDGQQQRQQWEPAAVGRSACVRLAELALWLILELAALLAFRGEPPEPPPFLDRTAA